MNVDVDLADVQGLVRFGHGHMTLARYDLLEIKDPDAALSWLRVAIPEVVSAQKVSPRPSTALQLAFSAPGLHELGVADSVTADFSHEFRTGMAAEPRARQIGDIGINSPQHWLWGRSGREPHALAMFFGDERDFEPFVGRLCGELFQRAFEAHSLGIARPDPVEPFGFADGISQPRIDWEQRRSTPTTQAEYTNIAALGEFLLGYPNEYGKLTDRPLLESDATTTGLLSAPEAPDKKDLARNGTYLVLRQLEQDVSGFWKFIHAQRPSAADAEDLAAAMVGRTRRGVPLVQGAHRAAATNASIDGAGPANNQFTFDNDPAGSQCPFGAHIRRANPRNTDYPEPGGPLKRLRIALGYGSRDFRYDLMSSVRFHRIMRRGRTYGPALGNEPADGTITAPSGLHFICLNANIARQFEFVQGAWIASSKFSGMTGEADPLLGTREPLAGGAPTNSFNLPADGDLRRRVNDLPQFVTLRGGAYFFLPSLRALSYFAHLRDR